MSKRRFEKHHIWAILIFGVAFLIRLIYLLQIKSNPFFYQPIVDELWNLRWAQEIMTGSFWGHEVFFRGPLYPYFLALLLKITASDYFWTRLIQMVIASGSAVLTYYLGREYFSDRVARLAGIFYAFCGILIFYEGMLLIPVLFVFLNLLGLFLLARHRDNPRKWPYFFIGLVFGLSAIARPNILLVLPFLAIWIIWKFYKKIENRSVVVLLFVFFMGIILPIAPVTIRNYMVADDFIPISSQGGINLYLGNNQSADGLTMMMPEMILDARIPWDEFIPTTTEYAEKQMGQPLTPSEVSAFWSNKAREFMLENPGHFIGLTFRKLVYLFSGFDNSDQTDIYNFRQYSSLFSILLFDYGLKFPMGLLIPFGLIGMVIGWHERRRLAPLYIFFIAYIPTIILFLVTARHRLTLIPIIMLFVAFAFLWLWDRIKNHKWKTAVLPGSAIFVLLLLANINFFDLGFQNISQIHYQLALNHVKSGEMVEGIREFRLALKEAPLAPAVHFGLGTALNQVGQYEEAAEYLSRAVSLDPDYADAHTNLGMAYLELSQLDLAERHFRRASVLDPEMGEPYLNLGDVYLQKGDKELARQYYQKALATGQKTAAIHTRLGLLLGQNGDPEGAYGNFNKAVEADSLYSPAQLNWGNILLVYGDTVNAIEKYKATIAIDSLSPEPYYNLAVLAIRQNDLAGARNYVDRLLQVNPEFQPALQLKQRLGN